ncbi:MAG: undecaprenyl-diphosphate phosphatase [Actinomycetota bacterium]|nr:undecaprenyl-diphosphate phosphatase [Actinomycetota bacterium]
MNIIQSIILGIIQGITEFFPVSSSGHMVILPYLFSWDYQPLYFTVTVHFATLASVVTIFYRDIYEILKALVLGIFKRDWRNTNNFRLGIFLIVATIPAAIVGFLLDDYVENLFSEPLIVAVCLIITALFLVSGEFRGRRIEATRNLQLEYTPEIKKSPVNSDKEAEEKLTGKIDLNDISAGNEDHKNNKDDKAGKVNFNLFIALITGIGQAVAILPGISRSGTTISFARFFGISRDEAVRFSFLLSVPIIFGSFILELFRSSDVIFSGGLEVVQGLIAAFISSYLAGLFAIKFIVKIVKRRNLNVFAIYCTCLAVVVFVFYIINRFM